MNKNFTIAFICAIMALAGQSAGQSGNGNGNSNGRDNWFPNRGNVGIGTRSPSKELEVIGDVKVSQTIYTNDLETIGLKATNLTVSQDANIGRNLKVTGNVGIGVVNPVERLEVGGNLKVTNSIFADLITIRKFTADDGVVNNSLSVGQKLLSNGLTGLGVSNPVERLEVAGNAKVTQSLTSDKINSGDGLFSRGLTVTQNLIVNGSIGLGVTSPSEKLNVSGNIKATGDITGTNIRGDKGYFNSLESNGNLVINGNVGIGVQSPTEKLEVGGNIKSTQGVFAQTDDLTGNLSAGGSLSVTGNVGIGVAPGPSKLTVAGDAYVNGMLTAENLTVKQNLTLQGAFSTPGPIGIGVASPLALLHVNGDGKFDGNVTANKIIVNAIEIAGANQGNGTGLNLGDNLVVNGSIAIGTNKVEGFKLSVNGKIRASDIIKVYPESQWSDFVFDKDYKLRSLEDVESFIGKKGHLPDMPSAKEVEKDGIDLGGMDAKLLQKIEELTLYMIEIKKENEILKKEVKALKSKSSR